ncbi:hypothetical protein ILYODFUR_028064 [Ilyodon furcidens]|uniref:Uncharacterized protein n=1 Tax=Ilyodon furcidens TaxID=33524 RepID=A0ABV0TYB2_9TELE
MSNQVLKLSLRLAAEASCEKLTSVMILHPGRAQERQFGCQDESQREKTPAPLWLAAGYTQLQVAKKASTPRDIFHISSLYNHKLLCILLGFYVTQKVVQNYTVKGRDTWNLKGVACIQAPMLWCKLNLVQLIAFKSHQNDKTASFIVEFKVVFAVCHQHTAANMWKKQLWSDESKM